MGLEDIDHTTFFTLSLSQDYVVIYMSYIISHISDYTLERSFILFGLLVCVICYLLACYNVTLCKHLNYI